MELKKLTDRIYYYPHQQEFDRPILAYIKGNMFSLAVDAGYSDSHVNEFYEALNKEGLKKPDFTAITHWHYDHTFGMYHIHGLSIAHYKTNCFLKEQQEKALNSDYLDVMKEKDLRFKKEYSVKNELNIVLSDIEFDSKITLNLGGLTAKIFHTESPHTKDTALIYIPEEEVLFLGDSTCEDFFNNGYMDKTKLKSLVEVIEKTECRYCILSHCEPLKKAELLEYLYSVLA